MSPTITDQDGTVLIGVVQKPHNFRMFSHLPEDVAHVLPPEQVAKDLAELAKHQREPQPWSETAVIAVAVTVAVIATPFLAIGVFHLLQFLSRP